MNGRAESFTCPVCGKTGTGVMKCPECQWDFTGDILDFPVLVEPGRRVLEQYAKDLAQKKAEYEEYKKDGWLRKLFKNVSCPVCGKTERKGLYCAGCGFDYTGDILHFPTLAEFGKEELEHYRTNLMAASEKKKKTEGISQKERQEKPHARESIRESEKKETAKRVQTREAVHQVMIDGVSYDLGLESLKLCQVRDISNLGKMKKLKTLELNIRGVTAPDLKPLEQCTGLEHLFLMGDHIENVDFLRNMPGLKSLCIMTDGKRELDLTPLNGLSGLRELYLYGSMKNYEAMWNLFSLETLGLNGSNFSDLNCLKDLSNLKSLNLSSTKVKDLKPLIFLPNLKELVLDILPEVEDFSPLFGLKNLKLLTLPEERLAKWVETHKTEQVKQWLIRIAPYCNVNIKKYLPLWDKPADEKIYINGLEMKPSTESLSITGAKNLTDLPKLKKLRELTLDLTGIFHPDLVPVGKCASLEKLNLICDGVEDTSFLAGLLNLQILNVKNERFSGMEIKGAGTLRGLKELSLQGNISDFSPLRNLSSLQKLNVSSSNFHETDLKYLFGMTGLKALDLSCSQVKLLDPLKNLPNLLELFLDHLTEVEDFSPLLDLKKLKLLTLPKKNFEAWVRTHPGDGARQWLQKLKAQCKTNINVQEYLQLCEQELNQVTIGGAIYDIGAETIYLKNVEDLTPLKKLKKLRSLTLRLDKELSIRDYQILRECTNLKDLTLEGQLSGANGLTGLEMLQNITTLRLYYEPNEGCKDLLMLYPVGQLQNLERLILNGNMGQYTALEKLPELWDLDLSHSNFINLQNIQGLTKLHRLCISGTNVTDISPLLRFPLLHTLDLEGLNGIRDFSPLLELKNLSVVFLPEESFDRWMERRQDQKTFEWLKKIMGSSNIKMDKYILHTPDGDILRSRRGEVAIQKISDLCSQFLASSGNGKYHSGVAVSQKLRTNLNLKAGERVFLAHDDTWMKSGKNGFAISERGVHCRDIFGSKVTFVSYKELAKAKKIEKRDGCHVFADNNMLAYITGENEKNWNSLISLFQTIANTPEELLP